MAHITVSVEYGIHSLLWLVSSSGQPLSSRDLADFQGISHSLLAKILNKLEKAGILRSSEGARGGYVLARDPHDISFLHILDAIEGRKPLFDCQEIRGRCAVFGDLPPAWATDGVCSVHVVMLQAEKAMRDTLSRQSLAALSNTVSGKAPAGFVSAVNEWMGLRLRSRRCQAGQQLTRREGVSHDRSC